MVMAQSPETAQHDPILRSAISTGLVDHVLPPAELADKLMEYATYLRRLRDPLPVPSTAIYSRTDGIVAWQSCVEEDGPQSESIAVQSSHCGMGHHPGVLLVIADRLAQPEGTWKPYVERRAPHAAAAMT